MKLTLERMRWALSRVPVTMTDVEVMKLIDALALVEGVETDRQKFRSELEAARKAYEAAVAQHADRERELQARCPHVHTTYHADPSGNKDSRTVCDLCDAEV